MNVKRITGTRSYITVYLEDRSLNIQGELTTMPAFYAERDSINYWNVPHQNTVISAIEKEELIKKITEFNNDPKKVKILFED